MNSNQKKQTLEQGTFILLFASVLVKIISALFKIPLSSNLVLGDLGFGYFSAAHDLSTPIHTLAVSGFPVAIAKVIADYSASEKWEDANLAFKLSRKLLIWLSLLFVLLFLVIAVVIYFLNREISGSFYSYLFVIPSSVFCIVASSYRGSFEGRQQMTPVAISNVIEALCKLLLGLSFATIIIKLTGNAAFGAAAAMFGIFIGSLFSFLYLHFYFKKHRPFPAEKSQTFIDNDYQNKLIKTILLISISMIISSLSGSIVTFIDSVTVRTQLTGLIAQNNDIMLRFADIVTEAKKSTGDVIDPSSLSTILYGIRSKGYTMFNLIPMLTVMIGVGATPVITENFVKKNYSEMKTNVVSVLKISSIIAFPAGIAYLFLGNRIMTLLYGNTASSYLGGKILALYGIAVIFIGLALPLGNVLLAINRRKAVLINIAIGVTVKLLLNLILCSFESINIFGSVISTVVCYLIIFTLHFIVLLKSVNLSGELKTAVVKPFFAAFVCVISAFLVCLSGKSHLITILSIIVAVVVYVLFIILFRIFSYLEILKFPFGEKIYKLLKRYYRA